MGITSTRACIDKTQHSLINTIVNTRSFYRHARVSISYALPDALTDTNHRKHPFFLSARMGLST